MSAIVGEKTPRHLRAIAAYRAGQEGTGPRITQREAAKKAGVSAVTFNAWCREDREQNGEYQDRSQEGETKEDMPEPTTNGHSSNGALAVIEPEPDASPDEIVEQSHLEIEGQEDTEDLLRVIGSHFEGMVQRFDRLTARGEDAIQANELLAADNTELRGAVESMKAHIQKLEHERDVARREGEAWKEALKIALGAPVVVVPRS